MIAKIALLCLLSLAFQNMPCSGQENDNYDSLHLLHPDLILLLPNADRVEPGIPEFHIERERESLTELPGCPGFPADRGNTSGDTGARRYRPAHIPGTTAPINTPPGLMNEKRTFDVNFNAEKNKLFSDNRRNRYSALWAFTSLNYLYADLVGLMDKKQLRQYYNGSVDGVKITPGFLTAAAGFMQIPLCNVFLPQVIKNEKTLRWVQIGSGTVMTLVQAGTLFMGKSAPYYLLFSAIEIGTTAYITIDAIKWKPRKAR